MKNPDLEQSLRAVREDLFWRLENCNSAGAFYEWQKLLTEKIREAESTLHDSRTRRSRPHAQASKEHLTLLRELGDAAAWRRLDPVAIRQLAKHGLRPPRLTAQVEHTDFCLEVCAKIAESQTDALVADLTNDLGLGDVVVVDDADAPTLIECKLGKPHAMDLIHGRTGRQYSRMRGTAEYLRNGSAFVYGEEEPRRSVMVPEAPSYIWDTLQRAAAEALSSGCSVEEVEPGRVLIARRNEVSLEEALHNPAVLAGVRKFHYEPVLGTSRGFLDPDAPLMPPLTAWEIDPVLQLAAFEGDLVVVQLIDPAVLEKRVSGGGVSLEAMSIDGATHFSLRAGEIEAFVPNRCLHLLLYHFWTVDSVGDMLRYAATSLPATLESFEKHPAKSNERPVLLESDTDVEDFIRNADTHTDNTTVIFSPELLRRLERKGGKAPRSETRSRGAILLYKGRSEEGD